MGGGFDVGAVVEGVEGQAHGGVAVGGATEDAVGAEAVVGQRSSRDAFQADREDPGTRVALLGCADAGAGKVAEDVAGFGRQGRAVLLDGFQAQVVQQLNRGAPGGVEREGASAELVALGVWVQADMARREVGLGRRAGPAAPGMQAFLGIATDVHGANAVRAHAPLEGREGHDVAAKLPHVGGARAEGLGGVYHGDRAAFAGQRGNFGNGQHDPAFGGDVAQADCAGVGGHGRFHVA